MTANTPYSPMIRRPETLGKISKRVSGQLDAEVAIQVHAETEAVVVVDAGQVLGVAGFQLEIAAQLMAVLSSGRGDGGHRDRDRADRPGQPSHGACPPSQS